MTHYFELHPVRYIGILQEIQTQLLIKSGIGYGIHFEMIIYEKTTGSNNCCSQRLSIIQTCPGATRVGLIKKQTDSSGRQIFATPEFQSKRTRHTMPLHCKPFVKLRHSPDIAELMKSNILHLPVPLWVKGCA